MKTIIYGNILNFDTSRIYYDAMVINEKGRIIYLGSKEIATKFIQPEDKILDYGHHFVYPGFMDGHAHGCIAAKNLKFSLDLTKGESFKDYITILKNHIIANPDKRIYLGHGWLQYETPNKKMLDDICQDKPIILSSLDCHSRWLNSKALELLKLTPEQIKEFGPDKIHVDEKGNPTGWIGESAITIVDAICELSKEEMKEGLLAWQDFAFKNGLTGAVDAAVDKTPSSIEAYNELVKEGKWKLRTYGYGLYKKLIDNNEIPAAINQLKADQQKYNNQYFQIVGLKVFIDGVVEAHTASMLKPYKDTPDYYGVNYFENNTQKLTDIVYEANKNNIPVHFHTIGDKAVKTALDAIEQAAVKKGALTKNNVLAHLQFVTKADVTRLADLAVVAVVAPLWMPIEHPTFDNELKWIGEKRAYEEYPLKSFEKAGALLCFHTDYPISTKINTAEQFFAAARRATTSHPISSAKNTTECISPTRALIANSLNVAIMVGDENVGSFGIGKVANCCVFDINFLECDPDKTKNCHLIATIVDGQEVYRR